MESQRQSKIMAVAFGLSHSGDECSEEKAGDLPASWTEALGRVIFRISGIELSNSLDSFRDGDGVEGPGEDGGSGDAAALPGGSAASPEPAGVDQATA